MNWELAPHFSLTELNHKNLTVPAEVLTNLETLSVSLERLREFCRAALAPRDIRIRINAAYDVDGHSPASQHYLGKAADIVIFEKGRDALPLYEQYELVRRHGLFPGIGVYPHWNTPGLHIDLGPRRQWWKPESGPYLAINDANKNQALGLA